MFLKKENKLPEKLLSNNKTFWLSSNNHYKIYLYEDIFIRNYITSFLLKWSKGVKILGSIYILRTLGKLYINVYFFSVFRKSIKLSKKSSSKSKRVYEFKQITPLKKNVKWIFTFVTFYNLEKLLNTQIFFKFTNICSTLKGSKVTKKFYKRFLNFLVRKFYMFKYRFDGVVYFNTLSVLVHIFKFKQPDSTLLVNYLAKVLSKMQKQARFLFFVQKVLKFLRKVFKFKGVKISLFGKLNNFRRAQSKTIRIGRVPLQSVNSVFRYGAATAYTKVGTIGIKVWIC